MQRRADASEEAAGFRRHGAGGCTLVVVEPFERAALGLGLLEPGGLERALARGGGARGRAATAVLPLEGREERLHLRAVRHGGLLAPLWGDRIADPRRPLRELRVTARLRERGAPVPRPALVAARRLAGPFWRAALATVHEEDSCDGIAFLHRESDPERLRDAAAAAGRATRRLHDAGARHRDLHVGNLLLRRRDGGFECWILDLDRARLGEPAGPARRAAELARLYRSLANRQLATRVGDAGCAAFFDAYVAGDDGLRRALLAQLPRQRRRLALRRWVRRLTGRAAPR